MGNSKIPSGDKYSYYKDNSTGIEFWKTNGVITISLETSTLSGTTYAADTKIVDIPEAFLPRGTGFSFRETLRNTRLSVSNTTTRKGLYTVESTEGYNVRGGVTYAGN